MLWYLHRVSIFFADIINFYYHRLQSPDHDFNWMIKLWRGSVWVEL